MAKRISISKSVKFTLHNEEVISVKDDANAAIASSALADFLNYKTAKIVTGEGKVTYVPFHAVIKVEVEEETTETEFEDDTCKTSDDSSSNENENEGD